jgi:hypothetical protein
VRGGADHLASRIVDLEGVDRDPVGARVDLRRHDVDALGGEGAGDEREEPRHVAGHDDEVGGAEVGVVEQLGHDRRRVELAQHPQVFGHPLHARARDVAVGRHRQVRLDGLEVRLALRRRVQAPGELRASAARPGRR